jgi:hypothetical protein
MPYQLIDIPEEKIEAMWKQQYGMSVPTNKDTVTYEQYQLFRDSVRERDMHTITGEGFILMILVFVAVFMFLKVIKEIYQNIVNS